MLTSAIGESLPMAIGVALSPVPVAAAIIIMLTAKARTNAPAFLLGWITGILTVGLLVFILPGIETSSGEPTTLSGYIKIALGIALLALAAKQWQNRPKAGDEISTPKFFKSLDQFGFGKSLLTGFLLSAVNPKNTVLSVAGAAIIDSSSLDPNSQLLALLVFTAVAGSSVLLPVIGYFLFRERTEPVLRNWKDWLIQNNLTVLIVLLIVFGTLLIGDGITIANG
jgi:threonine/homoserine/homoserine lactone efflux protein